MTNTNWTHTAVLKSEYPVGAEQFGQTVKPGTRVTLYKDPAEQEGDLITFRYGSGTGVARLSDLMLVRPVPVMCEKHKAFEADYCPSCGTSVTINHQGL